MINRRLGTVGQSHLLTHHSHQTSHAAAVRIRQRHAPTDLLHHHHHHHHSWSACRYRTVLHVMLQHAIRQCHGRAVRHPAGKTPTISRYTSGSEYRRQTWPPTSSTLLSPSNVLYHDDTQSYSVQLLFYVSLFYRVFVCLSMFLLCSAASA